MAFLLLGFVHFQGMVFCFESDGKVSLETAIGGICSDSFQNVSVLKQSGETNLKVAHCKQCKDMPISIEANEHQNKPFQLYQSLSHILVLTGASEFSIGYLAKVSAQQMPQPPPNRSSIHKILSTVKLII
jgi:hypothetical protein